MGMVDKRKPKVSLVSLGCPKNLVDSEKILAHLAEGGCVVGASMDEADVIIVNTCGFLSAAEQESLDVIAEAVGLKITGSAKRVVVAGCLVNRDAKNIYRLAPSIDAVVGVNDRDGILKAVLGSQHVTKVTEFAGGILSDAGRFRLTPRHTAYLRISEGCSQRCTFCTIPAIRGPFRSKPPAQVVAEAEELVADGAVELNIIGQDTTSYGRDIAGAGDLASLLRKLNRIDGLRRLRLMYAYPLHFTERLIDAMADCENVVHYVDMPLQHISDRILRRMGRRVSRAATEKLLDRLRRRMPDIVIRTAFIVGFPGETEREFTELLEFVRAFRFDALGVFEFSPERGTPAMLLGGQVPDEVKADRARQAMLAQQEIAFAANRKKIGRTVEVLVDGMDSKGKCVGRHYGQAPDIDSVCILKHQADPGSLAKCKVVGCKGYDLVVKSADKLIIDNRKLQ